MTARLETLRLPLSHLQVIEASAGTGKTWTLCALYVRLVLGHGISRPLLPPEILVMTFTEMATAELRGRIRKQLFEVGQYFQMGEIDAPQIDDFQKELKGAFDPSQWGQCAKTLELAAQWMDEAAIFTIHAWSARMLKEHAFDSKSLFDQSLTDDPYKLKLSAAETYWRKYIYPLSAEQLAQISENKSLGSSPKDMLQKLKPYFSKKEKSPDSNLEVGISPLEYSVKIIEWSEEFNKKREATKLQWNEEFVEKLKKIIKDVKNSNPTMSEEYTAGKVTPRLKKVMKCLEGMGEDLVVLKQFSASELKRNGVINADEYSELRHLDELVQCLTQKPLFDSILNHVTNEIQSIYDRTKSITGQFDFSDLLQNLYHAVNAEGSALATTIRAQYPVALVDEFQDTDPWQYGTLKKIYVDAPQKDSALIIIGDPKQAIYGFRGADLETYLKARNHEIGNIYTLPKNYRSTSQLISAVNHIFLNAQNPFKDVEFLEVDPGKEIAPLLVKDKGGGAKLKEQPAVTVWHSAANKPLNNTNYKKEMSAVFAAEMVALLNSRAAEPNEMAVLVRDVKEATAIRQALARLGVRSVYLSDKESVYATEEAFELRLILLAAANPKSTKNLRAAVSTRIWGLNFSQLEQLIHSEGQWDLLIEEFHRYQTIWQKQGLLPMLYRLIHDNSIAQKLLNSNSAEFYNGERVLTNLLHLGDLLQSVSLGLHGEAALIRYLEQQLNNPRSSGDASVVRLESEANLVRVLTIHKSKGLEFPLVFLPFISNFRTENKDSGRDDKSRIEEDIRLFYVAVTRAQKALWMGLAPVKDDFIKTSKTPRSAVSVLLQRQDAGDLVQSLSLWSKCGEISVLPAPIPVEEQYVPVLTAVNYKPARDPIQTITTNWWIASFSNITKGAAKSEEGAYAESSTSYDRFADAQVDSSANSPGSFPEDESQQYPLQPNTLKEGQDIGDAQAYESPYDALKSSSAFGVLLHDLLEWQFNQNWPLSSNSPNSSTPTDWMSLFESKSLKIGLSDTQQKLLLNWIGNIVNTEYVLELSNLPHLHRDKNFSLSSLLLSDLNSQNAWAEMSFTLPIGSMNVASLDAHITAHVLAKRDRPALQPKVMSGMLTGFMDLVFEAEGRYYVLDYKSNLLKTGYAGIDLEESILSHRYDVQYTLYLLALHRLLKSRLQGYDYDEHIGGAIYLYLRGVDSESQGIFVDRPPKELILSIDEAFKGVG